MHRFLSFYAHHWIYSVISITVHLGDWQLFNNLTSTMSTLCIFAVSVVICKGARLVLLIQIQSHPEPWNTDWSIKRLISLPLKASGMKRPRWACFRFCVAFPLVVGPWPITTEAPTVMQLGAGDGGGIHSRWMPNPHPVCVQLLRAHFCVLYSLLKTLPRSQAEPRRFSLNKLFLLALTSPTVQVSITSARSLIGTCVLHHSPFETSWSSELATPLLHHSNGNG